MTTKLRFPIDLRQVNGEIWTIVRFSILHRETMPWTITPKMRITAPKRFVCLTESAPLAEAIQKVKPKLILVQNNWTVDIEDTVNKLLAICALFEQYPAVPESKSAEQDRLVRSMLLCLNQKSEKP